MALDVTARENDIWLSIKKFFVDNLYTTEGIELVFDKTITDPPIVSGQTVTKWVTVTIDEMNIDTMSVVHMDVWCCVRKDPEWHELTRLRDTVMKYLTDPDRTVGGRVITLYDFSTDTGVGGIIVNEVYEGRRMRAEDGTCYKILACQLRFASKV